MVLLSVERHQLTRPQRAHHLDLLFDSPATRGEIYAERLELHRVPADGNAEAESSTRKHIDRGGLLGDERGLALRQDDDARHQLDPARDRGEKSEEHERLVEGVTIGVRPFPSTRTV